MFREPTDWYRQVRGKGVVECQCDRCRARRCPSTDTRARTSLSIGRHGEHMASSYIRQGCATRDRSRRVECRWDNVLRAIRCVACPLDGAWLIASRAQTTSLTPCTSSPFCPLHPRRSQAPSRSWSPFSSHRPPVSPAGIRGDHGGSRRPRRRAAACSFGTAIGSMTKMLKEQERAQRKAWRCRRRCSRRIFDGRLTASGWLAWIGVRGVWCMRRGEATGGEVDVA